jgi:hypothetical protein
VKWRIALTNSKRHTERPKAMEQITVGNKYRSSNRYEGRSTWVLAAYTISGLALFGVLAYFFSNFIAH